MVTFRQTTKVLTPITRRGAAVAMALAGTASVLRATLGPRHEASRAAADGGTLARRYFEEAWNPDRAGDAPRLP